MRNIYIKKRKKSSVCVEEEGGGMRVLLDDKQPRPICRVCEAGVCEAGVGVDVAVQFGCHRPVFSLCSEFSSSFFTLPERRYMYTPQYPALAEKM